MHYIKLLNVYKVFFKGEIFLKILRKSLTNFVVKKQKNSRKKKQY